MIWSHLKRLLRAGSTGERDGGIYVFVCCDRCGDRVRVRLNPQADLQQEFEDRDGVSGYSVRKMIVDQRCFRPIELSMRFDNARREIAREIHGGTFISGEEYEHAAGVERSESAG